MDGMTLQELNVIIDAQIRPYREQMEQVKKLTRTATAEVTKQTTRIHDSLAKIGKIASIAAIGTAFYKLGKTAISTASNLTEVQNVVDVAFGDLSYKMEEFAKNSIDQFGIAELTAKKTGSVYMAMGKGIGLANDASANMALNLTALSADMASFFNVSQSEVDTALKSIYTGETESIKRFGVAMTEVNMQEYARQQGINKSIEAMTQSEKVQLRYAYVTSQLSMANGDFARTSDTWANQTRILSERFKQLLGILGNGLIQVLNPALQMLNKMMSALVSFAQTFSNVLNAMFGKKAKSSPAAEAQKQINNTTSVGTNLQNEYNDSIDETGKKANKAAKEVKNLFGVDELHVMPSKSTGGADGTGGNGGGSGFAVDPIDFGFTEEQDISGIEKTVQKIQALLSDIFKPFVNSWNKYAQPIIENLKSAFDDIVYIGKDVFNVICQNWQTTMQPISDLVLGLVETITLGFKTVTTILRSAWDNGGKYLFDQLLKFVGSMANLAGRINDEFVKPFIRWFNDNLAPIIGKVLGGIMTAIGNVLNALTKIMNFIASNKAALTGFISIIGTMVAAWVTSKMVTWVNKAGSVIDIVGRMKKSIKDVIETAITKLYVAYDDSNKALLKFGDNIKKSFVWFKDAAKNILNTVKAWKEETLAKKASGKVDISKTFKNIIDSVKKGIKAIGDWIKQLFLSKEAQAAADVANKTTAASTIAVGAAQETAAVSTGVFSKALTFLAANPMIAVVGAIGGAIAAFTLFKSGNDDASESSSKLDKELKALNKSIKQNAEDIKDRNKALSENLSSINADYAVQQDALTQLVNMTGGEDGYVENVEEAQYYIDKINEILPESVRLTEAGRVEWLKTPDAIQAVIQKLKDKAKLEAYEEEYKNSLKAQEGLNHNLAKAVSAQSKAQKEYNKYIKEQMDAGIPEEIAKYNAETRGLKKTLDDANNALEKAKKAKDDNAIASKNWQAQEKVLNGRLDEQRQALIDLATAHKGVNAGYTDMMVGLSLLDERIKTTYGDEQQCAIESKDTVLAMLAVKAASNKQSAADTLAELQANGIALSEEEKKQLETSISDFSNSKARTLEILKLSGVDMNAETTAQYNSLFAGLKQYDIKVDSEKATQYQKIIELAKQNGIDLNSIEGKSYVGLLGLLEQHGLEINNENAKQCQDILTTAEKNGIDLKSKKGQMYTELLGLLVSNGVKINVEDSEQYKKMVNNADKLGIKLSDKKGQQYVKLLAQLKKHNIDVNSEEGKDYITKLTNSKDWGKKQGEEYIKSIGKGQEKQKEPLGRKTSEVIAASTRKVDEAKPEVKITVKADNKSIEDTKKVMKAALNSISFKITGKGSNLKISAYATGGFPEDGLFMANSGELVGQFSNGRTAVANNMQIISGIQQAVTQAFKSARVNFMSGLRPMTMSDVTDLTLQIKSLNAKLADKAAHSNVAKPQEDWKKTAQQMIDKSNNSDEIVSTLKQLIKVVEGKDMSLSIDGKEMRKSQSKVEKELAMIY